MTDLLCFLSLVPVSLSDDAPLLARELVLPFNCLASGKPSDGAEKIIFNYQYICVTFKLFLHLQDCYIYVTKIYYIYMIFSSIFLSY